MESRSHDIVGFAERVLALLDQGAFVATYKFAVLIALLDLCSEHADRNGEPPQTLTTVQLAEAVTRVYWRQAAPYLADGAVLRQNSGREATILRRIRELRESVAPPLSWFEAQRQPAFARLLREVEWVLVQMPLPKLQRFGAQEERFLYDIAWDDSVTRAAWSDARRFDNRLRLAPLAAASLVRLASLLRPLILERWARQVAQLNQLPEAELHTFLFGVDRAAVARLRAPLAELQQQRCFYCAAPLAPARTHVDHFIPWSRHPDDGLDNLVAADAACNASKRDFLPGHSHVERWALRFASDAPRLASLASSHPWPRRPERTLALVRSSLLTAPRHLRLWSSRDTFEPPDPARLRTLLAAL